MVTFLLWLADRVRDLLQRRLASPALEKRIVHELMLFMDGRRVLFDPMTIEEPTYVAVSVEIIRTRLSSDLERLPRGARATEILLDMRRACLTYLTRVPKPQAAESEWPGAINDLRHAIADGLEALEATYGLSMPNGTGKPTGEMIILPATFEVERDDT
jgi:hypothetical protein